MDFGRGLTNESRSSAVNRKWGPCAVLRKVFGWGEPLSSFFPHIVVGSWARLRGLKTEGLVQDSLWSLRWIQFWTRKWTCCLQSHAVCPRGPPDGLNASQIRPTQPQDLFLRWCSSVFLKLLSILSAGWGEALMCALLPFVFCLPPLVTGGGVCLSAPRLQLRTVSVCVSFEHHTLANFICPVKRWRWLY